MPVPGCGSRSMRSSTGLSVFAASEAHGWKTTVFICTAQTIAAVSVSTICGCVRPLLYVHITLCTKSGVPFGGFFEKKLSPSIPSR